ncbi:MAG: hypothetical protein MJZ96_01650 [Paludibacteraceae bacterium]|nr:hypothetical protein [Paludibacteraceae bacterium]
MIHTQQTIEEITIQLLQGSTLAIEGGFYHFGERPLNSQDEDCVVGLLAGTSEQIQEGYLNVHIYVPRLYGSDGVRYADRERCEALEQAVANISTELNTGGSVYYSTFGIVKTLIDDVTKETFVSAQLKFKFLTN